MNFDIYPEPETRRERVIRGITLFVELVIVGALAAIIIKWAILNPLF